MIPSNINIAVLTATPSTELTKAEIKLEPTLGHNLDVITQNIENFIYFYWFLKKIVMCLLIDTR